MNLLEESDWKDNKATTLSLYTLGAKSGLIIGNIDAATRYREAAVSRPDRSMLEILPLQIGKGKALCDFELKSKEALDYCLVLLKKLDCQST